MIQEWTKRVLDVRVADAIKELGYERVQEIIEAIANPTLRWNFRAALARVGGKV